MTDLIRPDKLLGVQYISYQDLIADVHNWCLTFPELKEVQCVPRSGLFVAGLIGSNLHIPASQIYSKKFRQTTGRPLNKALGSQVLVVDDTVSFGTAMSEVRVRMPTTTWYGAVYVQESAQHLVDFWYKRHADPDWLVLTQWNIFSHHDLKYVAVECEAVFQGSLKYPLRTHPAAVFSMGSKPEGLVRKGLGLSTELPVYSGMSLTDIQDRLPNVSLCVVSNATLALKLNSIGMPAISTETWKIENDHPYI